MISMDKEYKTRDGRAVRVLCVDRIAQDPVVYLVLHGKREKVNSCSSDGRAMSHGECPHDLIEVIPSVVFWVNLAEGARLPNVYTTQLVAKEVADPTIHYKLLARRVEIPIGE